MQAFQKKGHPPCLGDYMLNVMDYNNVYFRFYDDELQLQPQNQSKWLWLHGHVQ